MLSIIAPFYCKNYANSINITVSRFIAQFSGIIQKPTLLHHFKVNSFNVRNSNVSMVKGHDSSYTATFTVSPSRKNPTAIEALNDGILMSVTFGGLFGCVWYVSEWLTSHNYIGSYLRHV